MSSLKEQNETVKMAQKAMNRRSTRAKKDTMYEQYKYYIWGGGMTAIMVGGMLLMLIHPDRGPYEMPVNDDQNIGLINRQAKTWKAKPVEFFESWTIGDVKTLEGVGISNMGGAVQGCPASDVEIPAEFDVRAKWPSCFNYPVYEGGNCSSSWAIATATALSNRICISDPAKHENLLLSPQQLLSCDQSNRGCQGGDIDSAWQYISRTGLVSEKCFPYQGDSSVPCESKCSGEASFRASSHCMLSNEEAIQREVLTNGPVVAPLLLTDDILVYRDGVYKPMPTAIPLTDRQRQRMIHAVKIVGWGDFGGLSYWTIENSWGSDWGVDGYGKVVRGVPKGQTDGIIVDRFVMAGTPSSGKLEEATEDDFGEDIDIDDDDDVAVTDMDLDDDEV